jgi:peptidoglycan biosynthesis protein MviN/MurJ (putative lipid II flippase)
VSVRLRQQYGGVVAMFLLSMIAQVVIKLVIEWWFSRQSHRVLMHGWSSAAQNPNV